jgi:large subunit ribosomal protein L15e
MAEQKAAKKFSNCEVLNSYWVGEDGKHKYFEVILADASHPSVLADKNLKWIAEKQHSNRALRGLTSSARKSRD